jgi:RNA polymerase sigma factor (sigma-70 family)
VSESGSIEVDEEKLKQWLERGYSSVLRGIQALGLSKPEAEDAFQDAVIGLLDRRDVFESYDKFVAYLRTSARWRALDNRRHRARGPRFESELSEPEMAEVLAQSNSEEADFGLYRRELEQAIEALPQRSRDVVTLAALGMDSFEIAQRLHIKPASVRSLLRFARYRLSRGTR